MSLRFLYGGSVFIAQIIWVDCSNNLRNKQGVTIKKPEGHLYLKIQTRTICLIWSRRTWRQIWSETTFPLELQLMVGLHWSSRAVIWSNIHVLFILFIFNKHRGARRNMWTSYSHTHWGALDTFTSTITQRTFIFELWEILLVTKRMFSFVFSPQCFKLSLSTYPSSCLSFTAKRSVS